MSTPKKRKPGKKARQYAPKLAIPLPFDKAVAGLLAVKPEPKKMARKKNG